MNAAPYQEDKRQDSDPNMMGRKEPIHTGIAGLSGGAAMLQALGISAAYQPNLDSKDKTSKHFQVGDTLRMKNYPTAGGFRLWKVISHNLGGMHQEGSYGLKPLDQTENEPLNVPCVMLENMDFIERV